MPSPQAEKIILSSRQQTLLKQIVRRTRNPYRLVKRAQLILLAATGVSNNQLSQELLFRAGSSALMARTMASGDSSTGNCRSRKWQ